MIFEPRVFTFYSYKGGVGRSMALLNLAYFLHSRGRHVLMVDLDLEAPGVSGFLERNQELLPAGPNSKDAVDLLSIVIKAVRECPTPPDVPNVRLEDYLRNVSPKKYAAPAHPRAARTRFDVLAADDGETRDYPARLAGLDLASLSANQIATASDVLRAVLRQYRFPFQQPWQPEDEAPESTAYDYILVDSRTGLTEIGGLCVGPLADRLVVLCGLNDQNVFGTQQFLKLVGLHAGGPAWPPQQWDKADPPASDSARPATLGPKPTLLVASPVPIGEIGPKALRLQDLQNRVGLRPLKLSYHSQMALMETVFVRDHEDEYLALEYRTMAQQVMAMVEDTSGQWEARVSKTFAPRRGRDAPPPYPKEAPQQLARLALAKGNLTPYQYVSLQFAPPNTSPQILDQLRWVAIHLAQSTAEEAGAWLAWADALDTDSAQQSGDPAVFQSMNDKYGRAVGLKSDFYPALINWGSALSAWAQQKDGDEAQQLFTQATARFAQALALKPDDHEVLNNWGSTLANRANKTDGAVADQLFGLAAEKFAQALALKSDDPKTLNNWGNTLGDWANKKSGVAAQQLFEQAFAKYAQALALKPDNHKVLNNWGNTLGKWANKRGGEEAQQLFEQAAGKLAQAQALKPDDSGTYFNMACLSGLRGDIAGTVKALKKWTALDAKAAPTALDNDTDFDRVRDSSEFRAFRETLPA